MCDRRGLMLRAVSEEQEEDSSRTCSRLLVDCVCTVFTMENRPESLSSCISRLCGSTDTGLV